ncbi:MAG: 16S rRNA (uracil(1498)-N(3))-methyltransferase [Prevotella sp.]|nr:16S rRNA (uracil(1498)-N(3))-methyltransferase [Prevotella sp.]
MKEMHFFHVPGAGNAGALPPDEAVHATRVLRLQPGDEIFLIDGEGAFHRAKVTLATAKHCSYEVVEIIPQERGWRGAIHLAMAPTKAIDRVEWMAEKATEIGFDQLSFPICKFSERKVVKTERIRKIVVAAMKQSRKAWMPQVNEPVTFEHFISQPMDGLKCIAHCYDEVPRKDFFQLLVGNDESEKSQLASQTVTILIGPEGDFSIEEVRHAIDNGYVSVSLGTSRLRTETAALAAVMMAHLVKRTLTL